MEHLHSNHTEKQEITKDFLDRIVKHSIDMLDYIENTNSEYYFSRLGAKVTVLADRGAGDVVPITVEKDGAVIYSGIDLCDEDIVKLCREAFLHIGDCVMVTAGKGMTQGVIEGITLNQIEQQLIRTYYIKTPYLSENKTDCVEGVIADEQIATITKIQPDRILAEDTKPYKTTYCEWNYYHEVENGIWEIDPNRVVFN